jgi:hypothetical protein
VLDLRVLSAAVIACGLVPATKVTAQQFPPPSAFTTVGPSTAGVTEYLVTLQPTTTPGLYQPKLSELPLGESVTVSLSGTAFTPGSGCFVGGTCSSTNPSQFDLLDIVWSEPVNAISVQANGRTYDAVYGANDVFLGSSVGAQGGGVEYLPGTNIFYSFLVGGDPTATITSVSFYRAPEPGTLALLSLGVAALWLRRRRPSTARRGNPAALPGSTPEPS